MNWDPIHPSLLDSILIQFVRDRMDKMDTVMNDNERLHSIHFWTMLDTSKERFKVSGDDRRNARAFCWILRSVFFSLQEQTVVLNIC